VNIPEANKECRGICGINGLNADCQRTSSVRNFGLDAQRHEITFGTAADAISTKVCVAFSIVFSNKLAIEIDLQEVDGLVQVDEGDEHGKLDLVVGAERCVCSSECCAFLGDLVTS